MKKDQELKSIQIPICFQICEIVTLTSSYLTAQECAKFFNTCSMLRNDSYIWKRSIEGMIKISNQKFKQLADKDTKRIFMKYKFIFDFPIFNLDLVKLLSDFYPDSEILQKGVFRTLLKNDLKTFKWLHENRKDLRISSSFETAVWMGHFEIIKWLHKRFETCSTEAMDSAATSGQFEILKWLHENRTEGCTTEAMDSAATFGQFEILKWLHENRKEGCTFKALRCMAKNHVEIAKWLLENRPECFRSKKAMDYTAISGNLEFMEWLHCDRTDGCTTDAMDNAANHGHLKIVKWLHVNRTEGCTEKAMDGAASNGHFEVVKWLHSNRAEGCTESAALFAVMNGHLNIFDWLFHNRNEIFTAELFNELFSSKSKDMRNIAKKYFGNNKRF